MSALMIVLMRMDDDLWMADYARAVPGLLREYGAATLAGGRTLIPVEDDLGLAIAPNRAVVLTFPDSRAATDFMADPRYARFSQVRRSHSRSAIYVFDDEVSAENPLA